MDEENQEPKELSEKEKQKQEREAKIKEVKEEANKIEKKWKENLLKGDIIEEPEYFQMKHYINMAVNQDETGAIIKSRGGTGKTYTTLTYLTKQGIDYAYLNSTNTPLAFYIFLYKNRNKVKILDDVGKLLESDKFAPFLKAILEGYNGERVVSYHSSKPIEDNEGIYPSEFNEEGSTIILTNRINEKNIHIDAILSRVPMCSLVISNKRMLELMECIAKKPYKNMSVAENMEVLNFCKDALKNSLDLNLRTYNHARNFYSYAKNEGDMTLWQRLIIQSLKKDDTDLVIMQIVTDENYQNDEARLKSINSLLSDPISRSTYYRKLKELALTKSKKRFDKEEPEEEEKEEQIAG